MDRRHQRRVTPFKRQDNQDTARLLELGRRVFADLEDCRLAWQENVDPLALVVGVKKAEEQGTLPAWLVDALLVILFSYSGGTQVLDLQEMWADKRSETIKAEQASNVLAARTDPTHPRTWDTPNAPGAEPGAYEAGARSARAELNFLGTSAPSESAAVAKKNYHEVRAALDTNAGAFWTTWMADGLGERLKLALSRRAGRKSVT
jgi:hypothetical protein